jgi:putative nucleotidyltransferase with HDIG domain
MARRLVAAVQIALLTGSLVGAVMSSTASDWRQVDLLIALTVLTVVSDFLEIEARALRLSCSFTCLVLAMTLLGPAPAVAIAIVSLMADAIRRPSGRPYLLGNATAFATFTLAGGLMGRLLDIETMGTREFGLAVFAVFAVTNVINFVLVLGPRSVTEDLPFLQSVRTLYLTMLPSEALAGVLAVLIAVTERELGLAVSLSLFGVLFAFQRLHSALALSQDRSELLEARSTQLASLQVGVLAALVKTLSLRDRMTARHSAAVARYAKAIAREVGCTEAEQELVHTAGLLHDIGKFAFPDRILLADRRLDDDDWKIVRTHPYQGARLVQRIDGYGPVADIILAHHERIDGRGYPRGLSGDEVPLLSRMISIADTYDVMTARDSYRTPVSQREAVEELRRVSGAQLDGRLVEAFIRVLERSGLRFQHTTDADFERELDFEERVRGYAFPSAA